MRSVDMDIDMSIYSADSSDTTTTSMQYLLIPLVLQDFDQQIEQLTNPRK
jgi:hypothetical protein